MIETLCLLIIIYLPKRQLIYLNIDNTIKFAVATIRGKAENHQKRIGTLSY